MAENGTLEQMRKRQFKRWIEKMALFKLQSKLFKYFEQTNGNISPVNNTRTLVENLIGDFIKTENASLKGGE